MAKDQRLSEFGPEKYIPFTGDVFQKKRQLNFDDLFSSQSDSGAPPWNPSRFGQNDLRRRIQTRKLRFNPGLQYVGDAPGDFEVFAGIGRFNRKNYDFNSGRPLTPQRPETQPDFNSMWREMYALSPTLDPSDRVSNPMPRASNPDPNGFLMAVAERQAEDDFEGKVSVSQLLSDTKEQKEKEEEA